MLLIFSSPPNSLYFTIKVETYSFKSGKQCYNRQKFNRASFTCKFKFSCVKCADNHASKEYKIKDKTQNKCGDEHIANYGGCPKNPNILKSTKRPITIRDTIHILSSKKIILDSSAQNLNKTRIPNLF